MSMNVYLKKRSVSIQPKRGDSKKTENKNMSWQFWNSSPLRLLQDEWCVLEVEEVKDLGARTIIIVPPLCSGSGRKIR